MGPEPFIPPASPRRPPAPPVATVEGVGPDCNGNVPLPDYVLRYLPQEFSPEQKAQVRANIGAVSAEYVAKALAGKVDKARPSCVLELPALGDDGGLVGSRISAVGGGLDVPGEVTLRKGLTVNGRAYVSGNATFTGNVTFSDGSTSTSRSPMLEAAASSNALEDTSGASYKRFSPSLTVAVLYDSKTDTIRRPNGTEIVLPDVTGVVVAGEGIGPTVQRTVNSASTTECHAYGLQAHAEGHGTTAGNAAKKCLTAADAANRGDTDSGYGAHSEGVGAKAVGKAAHAEGEDTLAKLYAGHAEGSESIADGDCTHAEGKKTRANGYAAHAEGWGTVTEGETAHAGGRDSRADGAQSFAHGLGVVADQPQQAVFGRYNKSVAGALFSIGNGTDAKRSNAMEVYEGSVRFIDTAGTMRRPFLIADASTNPRTNVTGELYRQYAAALSVSVRYDSSSDTLRRPDGTVFPVEEKAVIFLRYSGGFIYKGEVAEANKITKFSDLAKIVQTGRAVLQATATSASGSSPVLFRPQLMNNNGVLFDATGEIAGVMRTRNINVKRVGTDGIEVVSGGLKTLALLDDIKETLIPVGTDEWAKILEKAEMSGEPTIEKAIEVLVKAVAGLYPASSIFYLNAEGDVCVDSANVNDEGLAVTEEGEPNDDGTLTINL